MIEPSSQDQPRDVSRPRYALFLVCVSVAATLICVCRFAPNISYLAMLHDPLVGGRPEVNRALSTEQQIADPFTPVDNPTNRAISWRMLFPVIAHHTGMPFTLYLAIPYVGVLLLFGTIAHVVCRETQRMTDATLATLFTGTLSWFPVSTGWLTYFDAWYLLGLIVVAFGRSRYALLAAGLLCPWIDERFLIGLPLALVVRLTNEQTLDRARRRAVAIDAAWAFGGAAPYVLIRLGAALLAESETGTTYLKELFGINHYAQNLGAGVWEGLRVGWIAVLAFLVAQTRRDRKVVAALLWSGVVVTSVFILLIAGDYSRSLSILLPVVVGGLIVLLSSEAVREVVGRPRVVIGVLLAVNLALPMRHVVGDKRFAIATLPGAIHNYQHPEDDPVLLNERGNAALHEGELRKAHDLFDRAYQRDPNLLIALINRAAVRTVLGDYDAALRDADHALAHAPPGWRHLDAVRQMREQILAEKGKRDGALTPE